MDLKTMRVRPWRGGTLDRELWSSVVEAKAHSELQHQAVMNVADLT